MMSIESRGRRVLITGGSAGLGYAAALILVEQGYRVAIAARDQTRLEHAAERLRALATTEVLSIVCDVMSASAIENLYATVEKRWGGVDILMNNAGGSSRGNIDQLSDSDWQHDFDLKLFSAIRLTRLVLPGMKERRWGRIINVLNTLAKTPGAGTAPTSVTRAAGMAYSKVLANEVAPFNVLVNSLCIGRIDSEQWHRFHKKDDSGIGYEEYLEKQGKQIPLGRLGKPEEFAGLVALLASDAGGYLTGTAINIDGGLSPAY
jgi:NAD(P)-dependent dehydrogenase (short-subunit alcohol dehydrogenase family)